MADEKLCSTDRRAVTIFVPPMKSIYQVSVSHCNLFRSLGRIYTFDAHAVGEGQQEESEQRDVMLMRSQ